MAPDDNFFFLLSKMAWAVLSPSNLIVILLIIAAFYLVVDDYLKARKIILPTAIVSFIIMIYPVGHFLIEPLESRFAVPTHIPEKVDGIIILGGGEELEQSLSWNVAELGDGGDRYIAAAKMASFYPEAPVIFTGGSGIVQMQDTGKESDIAVHLLTTIGIKKKRLIIESKSRNTYENFKFTKPLLPKYDSRTYSANGRYLLITSAYHMPRAIGVARKQKIDVVPYPVDFYSTREDFRNWGFDLHKNMESLERAWREWIGLVAYYFSGKTPRIFPGPRILIPEEE